MFQRFNERPLWYRVGVPVLVVGFIIFSVWLITKPPERPVFESTPGYTSGNAEKVEESQKGATPGKPSDYGSPVPSANQPSNAPRVPEPPVIEQPPYEEVVCNSPKELTKKQNRALDMLLWDYQGPLEVTKDLTDRPERAGVVIGEHCVIVFDTGAPAPPFDMSDYFDKCNLGGRTFWNCPASWDPQNQPQTGTP